MFSRRGKGDATECAAGSEIITLRVAERYTVNGIARARDRRSSPLADYTHDIRRCVKLEFTLLARRRWTLPISKISQVTLKRNTRLDRRACVCKILPFFLPLISRANSDFNFLVHVTREIRVARYTRAPGKPRKRTRVRNGRAERDRISEN